MPEGLRYLFSLDRPPAEIARDVVDIAIVAFLVYRALLVMKGTRAMQMSIGFVAFALLYLLAKYAQLATLMSVLSWLASSAILIVVVVFQADIRRALIRLGSKAWLSRGQNAQEQLIEEVVAATTELARHRMGALICVERDADVLEFTNDDGTRIDSEVHRDILTALFIPSSENKLHDGAILIRNMRIARAGLTLPLPEANPRGADPAWGTRHRAAIGITEKTDAIVVVVSEERGAVTVFFGDGHYVPYINAAALRQVLTGLFQGEDQSRAEAKPESSKPEKSPAKTSTAKTKSVAKTSVAPKATIDKGESSTRTPKADKADKKERRESKQSGRFAPVPRTDDEAWSSKTTPPPSVSHPMPSGSIPTSTAAADDDDEPVEVDETPTATATASVSKPMAQADLPASTVTTITGEDP